MTSAIAFARVGGDGAPEFFACARCGALYGVAAYSGSPGGARAAAEDCPQCRDRSEEKRVATAEQSREARIRKAKEVFDLDFCFGDDDGEGYATPEDAREAGQRGVFGATFRAYSVDLGRIIESALENHHEDASESDLVGLQALEAAADHFNSQQTGGSYDMDEKHW